MIAGASRGGRGQPRSIRPDRPGARGVAGRDRDTTRAGARDGGRTRGRNGVSARARLLDDERLPGDGQRGLPCRARLSCDRKVDGTRARPARGHGDPGLIRACRPRASRRAHRQCNAAGRTCAAGDHATRGQARRTTTGLIERHGLARDGERTRSSGPDVCSDAVSRAQIARATRWGDGKPTIVVRGRPRTRSVAGRDRQAAGTCRRPWRYGRRRDGEGAAARLIDRERLSGDRQRAAARDAGIGGDRVTDGGRSRAARGDARQKCRVRRGRPGARSIAGRNGHVRGSSGGSG